MNARQLTVLAGLAAVSVIATAAVLRSTATAVPSDHRGEPVVPALRSRAGELTGLIIKDGTNTFTIERRGNEFVAAESGFPVRLDAIRDVVSASAQLAFNEARTGDPARYGELGLSETGDGAAKEIVFKAANGDIADLFLGNPDTTAGSAGGGQFVRLKGQPQTWLARGNVRVPAAKNGWFANIDLDVKRNEIKKIELTGGGKDAVTAIEDAKQPGEFDLQNVPDTRLSDTFKVSRLATLFDAFSFQDVRKRTAPAPADARHAVADTADGVRLTLTSVGNPSDGWVQVHADPTDGKPDKAAAINAKTANYEFHLPSQQAEVLGWTMSDLTSEKPAEPKGPDTKPGPIDLRARGDAAPKGIELKHDDAATPAAPAPATAEVKPAEPAPAAAPAAAPEAPSDAKPAELAPAEAEPKSESTSEPKP